MSGMNQSARFGLFIVKKPETSAGALEKRLRKCDEIAKQEETP